MTVNFVSVDDDDASLQGQGDDFRANERSAPRRSTLISLRVLEGPSLDEGAFVSDLSAGGAFIRTGRELDRDERLRLQLELPTDTRPIQVTARVVRTVANGVGVRFEELSARDRARLRAHAGYNEMDDAIVRLQQQLGDLIPGNLLPLGELTEIENILRAADLRMLEASVIVPGRGFRPRSCRISDLQVAEAVTEEPESATLTLTGIELRPTAGSKVVYVAFADGPLYYAFEAVVLRYGTDPRLAMPRRLYVTERRTNSRSEAREVWCEFRAPHLRGGQLRLPVLDLGEGGASIRVAEGTPLLPGTHLPGFRISGGGELRDVEGASVRYVQPLGDHGWRVGLQFETAAERSTFDDLREHSIKGGPLTTLKLGLAMVTSRVGRLLRGHQQQVHDGVEVVRYRNKLGHTVAGIVDANFDTSDPDLVPDVAVVIAPALLKRKEVFGLQARTIVDDLGRDGRRVAVLRFDFCHILGESTMDPKLVAEGVPYLHYHMREMLADIEASVLYMQHRFHPRRRVLVTYSFAAIGARKIVRELEKAPVDHWVAPFGCPDHQDMMRNYLAGLDLHEQYRRGEGPELVYVHGRPIRGRGFYLGAQQLGLAFLEQAREDMSEIQVPVTWVVGTYDHWVTRSRVRSLLEAPGGGVREVFECATGHVLKEGAEAIEVFKLVSESISKHAFGVDRPARDPDLRRFEAQSRAEWARVKRQSVTDGESFWKEHLFGSFGLDEDGGLGYDIVLDHPDYVSFMARQAELLDARPGQVVADLGCGTGNLLMSVLQGLDSSADPERLLFLDLVPEAVGRTESKLLEHYRQQGRPAPEYQGIVSNLEISRLAAIHDFLSGQIYGIEALVGRVEGLDQLTARKVSASYGKELHEILRGVPSTVDRVRQLCPELQADEARQVLEIGRAARFLRGRAVADDLRPGVERPRTTADLQFDHLRFGASEPRFELDLPAASIDRIGCSLVLSYVHDPLTSLREMHRLLRPDGIVVVSSVRPNFDPSKIYSEEAEILHRAAGQGDESARVKLGALRSFANMMARLVELEDDGHFRFFSGNALKALMEEAGFVDLHVFEAFGSPPTTVVVRGRKPASN